ncbi:MAG: ABC transporter substrate-binding protein [Candidatus Bathyarchaeota archaeon]|nr:MAG: ABC transporter substrate-binding protein [Candidatus Bathyarchaeota archaeon]
MLKLSTSVCIIIFVAALFAVSIGAATYYHYGRPRPTYLRILHTHSSEMVEEIVAGFESWYQDQPEYGRPIEVTVIHTDPQTAFEKATTIFRKAEADVWWGGPLSLFEEAYNGLLPYNSTHRDDINLTHSYPLMDSSNNTPRWYAASLHGAGLMYNEHRLVESNLQIPQTWTNLTLQDYAGNITMVDPSESESLGSFIMLILQSKNWTSGWEYLVTLSALIETYDADEYDSALEISNDYLSLAVVPDSYAYERIAKNIPQIALTYLDATILQPDPIAILNKGTYIDEAKAFVDYVLAFEAQDDIGRYLLPIRSDATPPSEPGPFDPTFPAISMHNESLQEIIREYYRTWIAERHTQIKYAWNAIEEANMSSPYYEPAVGNFTYAGYYLNESEISAIYDDTDGWTNDEKIASYLAKWRDASREAYDNAIENAEKIS